MIIVKDTGHVYFCLCIILQISVYSLDSSFQKHQYNINIGTRPTKLHGHESLAGCC